MTNDLTKRALGVRGAAVVVAGLGAVVGFDSAKGQELTLPVAPKSATRHAQHDKQRDRRSSATKTASPSKFVADAFARAAATGLRRLDPIYVPKGLDIRFPSYSDTMLLDTGGLRSTLDRYGIGFIGFWQSLYAQNVLDTPLKVPSSYPPSFNPTAVAAGHQVYNGERPTYAAVGSLTVTFDTSRIGIRDGQVEAILIGLGSTWQPYIPNGTPVLGGLSYYQALWDRKLSVEFGIMDHENRFVGTQIGGTVATTFGPAAAIHSLLGLSIEPTPAFDLKYQFTNRLYDKIGLQRSTPVNGRFGNVFFDAVKDSPEGFGGSGADQGLLVVNEIGYRNDAAPGDPQTWVRIGGIYNTSRFKDFGELVSAPDATVKGAAGLYALADRQLIQTEPGSVSTAYRGIYVGATFECAPARAVAVSQYYEARIFGIGLLPGRPTDLASVVFNRQVFSPYLADQLNPVAATAATSGLEIPMAGRASNSTTISYLAHLLPGAYASAGLGYTDHPSALYFQREGRSLNFLAGLLTVL